MASKLVAQNEGPDLTLDRPVMLLGRHAECDIQLHSGKVSRRHCVIAAINQRLIIKDLGSTNGVRINGERVAESQLRDGDELAIGNFRYTVKVDPKQARRAIEDARLEEADVPVPLESGIESHVKIARKPADSANHDE